MEYFEVLSNAVYDAIEDGEVAIKVSCETMHKLIEMNKELLAAMSEISKLPSYRQDECSEMAREAIAKAKATS